MSSTSFPGSPKLLKGAFAVYEKDTPGTQPKAVLLFQFNPETLKRTLADRSVEPERGNVGKAKEDVRRVQGPPIETISLTIELDAVDQLEQPDENAVVAENGLHPALATLEMLMYPPSLNAQRIEDMAKQGKVQVASADLPLVLLVWGASRVVPVSITGFSVSEEAFDINLNPIRAKVDINLKVLTYMELGDNSLGRDAFIGYQKQKEQLAGKHAPGFDDKSVRELLPGKKAS
jgi:contractile injection system tube protein